MSKRLKHLYRKQRFGQLIRRVRNSLGQQNEIKALSAIQEVGSNWEWFIGARLSSQEEDAKGIDIVIDTKDIGKIFFQVKSSEAGVEQFCKKRRCSRIAVIMLNPRNAMPLSKYVERSVMNERETIMLLRSGKVASAQTGIQTTF